MPDNKGSSICAADRILSTATILFARSGYKGITTREIAAEAEVSEVTIFRHFPSKHDLYMAVMKSGMQQLHLRGELLAGIAEASDGRTALARTFELIARTLTEKPEILRLLQYSALELSADFDPLARKHLGEFVELTVRYLEPWIKNGELRCTSGRNLVFALIAIVVSYSSLHRVFSIEKSGPDVLFEACSIFYCN